VNVHTVVFYVFEADCRGAFVILPVFAGSADGDVLANILIKCPF